jgi:putative ABC transport system permease protein
MVKKKTKEMSIRKLYGARLGDTFKLFTKEQIRIALISNIFAIPISMLVMNKWLSNFQYKVDIGFFVFFKTFVITIAFTLLAVSFLIIKTHKTNLIKSLKHE